AVHRQGDGQAHHHGDRVSAPVRAYRRFLRPRPAAPQGLDLYRRGTPPRSDREGRAADGRKGHRESAERALVGHTVVPANFAAPRFHGAESLTVTFSIGCILLLQPEQPFHQGRMMAWSRIVGLTPQRAGTKILPVAGLRLLRFDGR